MGQRNFTGVTTKQYNFNNANHILRPCINQAEVEWNVKIMILFVFKQKFIKKII